MANFINTRRSSHAKLADAVHRSKTLSPEGLRERLFTLMFSGLVYPQIWEDPVVDLEALAPTPDDHIVAIASGGCNVASYLIAQPRRITALDLNGAHVALNKLKLQAAVSLPGYYEFHRFFAQAGSPANVDAYRAHIAPNLDAASRQYWEHRNLAGRQRISQFANGFYRYGTLGSFIGLVHMLARLNGCDPRKLLQARTPQEQHDIYKREIEPALASRFIKWLVGNPASLYALGIPPAQYRALAGDHAGGMIGALRERVERLACGYELNDNYFAWQAFGRSYGSAADAPLPPYLQKQNFALVREGAGKVDVRHESVTHFLRDSPAQSADCFVLLDAQDWMNVGDLNDLWSEITRTARPGARVIFRTAAKDRLLPGRVHGEVLSHWTYREQRSRELLSRDRSSIYGGFHLYQLNG